MPNDNPLNVYPSTFDVNLPIIAGGSSEDDVLACLHIARDRYAEIGTDGTYVGTAGPEGEIISVCALGAVAVADGHGREMSTETYELVYEQYLSDTAKEAICLLDEVAGELFHEARSMIANGECSCHGHLECVNEHPRAREFRDRDEAVLEIYDEAIRRLEQIPA